MGFATVAAAAEPDRVDGGGVARPEGFLCASRLDMLDGTPVLTSSPISPAFREKLRRGCWETGKRERENLPRVS